MNGIFFFEYFSFENSSNGMAFSTTKPSYFHDFSFCQDQSRMKILQTGCKACVKSSSKALLLIFFKKPRRRSKSSVRSGTGGTDSARAAQATADCSALSSAVSQLNVNVDFSFLNVGRKCMRQNKAFVGLHFFQNEGTQFWCSLTQI